MLAVAITGSNGPQGAALRELPDPQPASGEVRVRLAASALNHLDLFASRGVPDVPRRFPFVLGADGAGTIDAVGAGVSETLAGEEVVLNPVVSCGRCARCAAGERALCRHHAMLGEHRDGTHAELICVPSVCAVPKPAAISFADAAAGGVVYATAFRMLHTKARALPGEVCLIHGIGGGLATAALQLARLSGLVCVVTSSDDAKLARAAELGAAHGINYRTQDVVAEVRRSVGAVDIVVDSVGGAVWAASLRVLAPNGRLVNCGVTGGREATVSIVHLFWRQLEVLGSTMASDGEFREALRAVEAAGLRPAIDRVVPLAETPAALLALDRGEQFGKIVVGR